MKNKLSLAFNLGIFLLVLETAHSWMFWNLGTVHKAVIYILIFVLGLLNYKKQKNISGKYNYFVIATFFLFIANVMKTGSSVMGMAEVLLFVLIMWQVMALPIEQKKIILDFQTKVLAVLLLVSFCAWIVHYFAPMPYAEIQRPGFEEYPPAHNYYFFITTHFGLLDYRFHSIFLEPGHLGCIISFYVLANQFNFRNKYVLILSIVLLFTLSLAGYVIYFAGFLLYSIVKKKDSANIRRIIAAGIVFLGIWLFGSYYNGGDNYVNERIIERLQFDEASGDIAGDNRYTEVMEKKFQQTLYSSDFLFGISIDQYRNFRGMAGKGAGIKIWIIQKGLIGALVLFLGYYFIARGSKNKRWAMFMLLVYVISSYQRMYFFWASYLIPFICGSALPLLTKKKKNNYI